MIFRQSFAIWMTLCLASGTLLGVSAHQEILWWSGALKTTSLTQSAHIESWNGRNFRDNQSSWNIWTGEITQTGVTHMEPNTPKKEEKRFSSSGELERIESIQKPGNPNNQKKERLIVQ